MQIPMTSFRVSRSFSGGLAAIMMLSAGGASAQAPAPAPLIEYAVKFVCGRASGQGQVAPVATGFYFTDINVHNPNSGAIEFRKKFAAALPNQKPGKISEFAGAALKPDEAFAVECGEITKRLGMPAGSFVMGFAVFQTARELDVVAVYTAAASPNNPVVTLHMERVPKRP